jgi:hypothetical protein
MREAEAELVREMLTGVISKEISAISKDVQDIKTSQLDMSASHHMLAEAARSMAETFARSEERQSKFEEHQVKYEERQTTLEQTNQFLYKDKGITPNVFFLVTGTLCAVIILGVIWITNTSVKASLTSFEAGKNQAEALQAAKKEIIEEVKDGN